ncbi:MAG: hypothetical protein LBQ65_08090 [Tannerellaceae bacterium]|jgi:hypothetical protein|nr:hypothetical protein [Tannerellaceae bacterium]
MSNLALQKSRFLPPNYPEAAKKGRNQELAKLVLSAVESEKRKVGSKILL